MLKIMTIAIVAAAVLGAASIASAAPPAYRQARQSVRIVNGMQSGALTAKESRKLVRQQARIGATKRYYKRDGKLGIVERAHLNRMQNRASKNIWTKKHNRRVR